MKKQTNQQTKKSANKKPFSPTDFQVCKQTQPLDTLLIKGYRKRKKKYFLDQKSLYDLYPKNSYTHLSNFEMLLASLCHSVCFVCVCFMCVCVCEIGWS